jgi:hypothetical protein
LKTRFFLSVGSSNNQTAAYGCFSASFEECEKSLTPRRDKVLASAARVFPLLERLETRAQFVSRDRAMFAYDFICREPIGVCLTAELVRFQDGLIRDIELFFDARPFEAFQRAQAQRPSAN